MLVPMELTPPRHQRHKPLVEARRAQIEHHRDLHDREYVTQSEENRHLRDDVRDLDKIIKLLREEQKRLQRELAEKNKDADWLRTLLSEQTAKVKGFEKDQANLTDQLNTAKADLESLRETLKTRDDTITGLKDELVASMRQYEEAQQALNKRSTELQRCTAELQQAKERHEDTEQQREALDAQIADLRKTMDEMATRCDESEAALKELKVQHAQLEQDHTSTLAELETAKAQLPKPSEDDEDDGEGGRRSRKKAAKMTLEMQESMDTLTAEVQGANDKIAELEAALNAKAGAYSDEIASLKGALDRETAAHAASKEQVKSLSAGVAGLSTENASLQDALAKLEKALDVEKQGSADLRSDLGDAENEIARLTEISQMCEDLAIQVHDFREQRRVAEEFSSRVIQDYADQLNTKRQQVDDALAERDDAVALAAEKSRLASTASTDLSAAQSDVARLRKDLNAAESRCIALTSEVERLQSDVVKERLAKADFEAQLKQISGEGQHIVDAMRIAQAEIERQRRDLESAALESADLRGELARTAKYADDVAHAASAQAQQLANENAALRAALDEADAARQELLALGANGALCRDPSHESLLASISQLQTESMNAVRALQDELSSARQGEAAQTRRVQELEAKMQRLEADAQSAPSVSTDAAVRASLENQVIQLQREVEAKADQMKKAKSDFDSRLERERNELNAKLKMSESQRAELDASLQAKVKQIRQQQESLAAADKKSKEALAKAAEAQRASEASLRDEIARLTDKVQKEATRRTAAESAAFEAAAIAKAANAERDAMRETQLHW